MFAVNTAPSGAVFILPTTENNDEDRIYMGKTKKTQENNWLKASGVVLILAAVVLLICFLVQGRITITSKDSSDIKNIALLCASDTISYSFFETESEKHSMEVNVIFVDDIFRSVSLKYTLFYGTYNEVKDSEAVNRSAMGVLFGKNGIGASSFKLAFSMQDSELIYSIYANQEELMPSYGKFFLANNLSYKSSLDDFRKNYEYMGFNCTTKE